MSVYAVNSKEPILAWIPSLDTAGNGTTTLTDLVGSNHGTLTNFALTGSTSNWVADTNNGGVRALDFDGSNDFVLSGSNISITGAGARSVSAWVNFRALGNRAIFGWGNAASNSWFVLSLISDKWYVSGFLNDYDTTVSASTGWQHVVVAYDGSTITVFVNGVSIGSTTKTFATVAGLLYLGRRDFFTPFSIDGRIDDVRIWNQSLVLADAEYLYASGNGRGRLPSTGESRRRRQSVSGGVL